MYSNVAGTGITGGTLAATGLSIGSSILVVLGVIFVIVGLYMVLRPDSKHRP